MYKNVTPNYKFVILIRGNLFQSEHGYIANKLLIAILIASFCIFCTFEQNLAHSQEVEDYYKESMLTSPDLAYAKLSQSRKVNLSDADAKFLKAIEARKKATYDIALKYLDEILWFKKNRFVKDEEIYFEQALNFDKQGLIVKAMAAIEASLKANPNYQPARLFLLITQLKGGQRNDAIKNSALLLNQNPKNVFYQLLQAKSYLTRTNRITDLELITKARDLSGKIYNNEANPKTYRIAAGTVYVKALVELKELDKAKMYSDELVKFSSDDAEVKKQNVQVGIEIESAKLNSSK